MQLQSTFSYHNMHMTTSHMHNNHAQHQDCAHTIKAMSLLAAQGFRPPADLLSGLESALMHLYSGLKAHSMTTLLESMALLSKQKAWKKILVDRLRAHAVSMREDLSVVRGCCMLRMAGKVHVFFMSVCACCRWSMLL